MSVNEKMTAIADRLRGYTASVDTLSLDEMATAVDVAFSQGVLAGQDLIRNHSQDMGDDFWKMYQANGKRTDYSNAFAYDMFTDESFKPRYKLNVANARQMFSSSMSITDLSAVNMDFSKCTDFYLAFRSMSALVKFGDISVESAMESVDEKGKTIAAVYRPFLSCSSLVEVGTVTIAESTTFDNMFAQCAALEKVKFAGCIGQDFTVRQSPLNRASIESLVECLSTEAEGKALTLKSGIVDAAFETSEGAADGRQVFENLIADKTNWKFSY